MSGWTQEEIHIFELFRYRCGNNAAHKAVVLHEIEPKSRRPKTWKDPLNRIPLCNECHVLVHRHPKEYKDKLKKVRMGKKNASDNSTTTNI